jgi:ribonuclease P protein component
MSYAFTENPQKLIKSERLCSKNLIDQLFSKGSVKKFTNIRFHFLGIPLEDSEFHQVLFSVPNRLFKKATDRNRIRRQMKESYRQNKLILYTNSQRDFSYLFAYVYISGYAPAWKELEQQVIASIQFIVNKDKK